jgi:pimeloyl-ACP methyl ester carboxylesterase
VRPWEIPAFIRANNLSLQAMMEELAALDLHETVPAVDVPVLFALGRHDRQVDSRLAAEYFRLLDAPGKGLVWFEGSAHNVPFEEPARFNQVVRELLLRPHGGQP